MSLRSSVGALFASRARELSGRTTTVPRRIPGPPYRVGGNRARCRYRATWPSGAFPRRSVTSKPTPAEKLPHPSRRRLDFASLFGGRTAEEDRMGLRGISAEGRIFGYIKPAENLDLPQRKSPVWGYLAARRITAAPAPTTAVLTRICGGCGGEFVPWRKWPT